jgi:predicted tellurium resistance membrane protein TerC
MPELFTAENGIALLTLTALEIVLGIDNIIVLAVITARLPPSQQVFARRLGLGLAMFLRILLLLTISWILRLERPLFTVQDHGVSGRDLILLGGGLFLIAKATKEIHEKMEGGGPEHAVRRSVSFASAIAQILLLDAVFSIDSVITAVGMAQDIRVMVAAVVIAVATMMVFAGAVGGFVERHPTIKVLALSFLVLIGVLLVADGLGQHLQRGYVYFAMAFSLGVELINVRVRGGGAAHGRSH